MISFREYSESDAKTILSFINEEKAFYKWSAGVLGSYPLSEIDFINKIDEMKSTKVFYPYVMLDSDNVIGFFILRFPNKDVNSMTIGFVIIDPNYRGKGIGKKMVNEAINLAFNQYKANSVNLRVFECNPSAYNCYKSLGFKESGFEMVRIIKDEEWKVIGLELYSDNKK